MHKATLEKHAPVKISEALEVGHKTLALGNQRIATAAKKLIGSKVLAVDEYSNRVQVKNLNNDRIYWIWFAKFHLKSRKEK